MSKCEKQKGEQKRGRYIFGTLTRPKDTPFTGTNEEMKDIFENLNSGSKSIISSVISREEHDDETLHYHFVLQFKRAVEFSLIKTYREHFDKESKTNEIEFGRSEHWNMIGYVTKHGDYIFQGNLTNDQIKEAQIKWKESQKEKMIEQKTFTKVTDKRKKEKDMYERIKRFMIENNYLINPYKERIYGCEISNKEFFDKIKTSDAYEIYGDEIIQKILNVITNQQAYGNILPEWKPELTLIKFKDCYFDLNSEERIEFTKDNKNRIPVRDYDVNFPENANPKLFISILKNNNWGEEFIEDYKRQFKEKRNRDRVLYIYGEKSTSKSSVTSAFKDVFKDVLEDLDFSDGVFGFSKGAKAAKLILNEVNIMDANPSYESILLKICEGESDLALPVKHSEPILAIPKGIVITTNYSIPDNLSGSKEAMRDRMSIHQTIYSVSNAERKKNKNFKEQLIKETPEIISWLFTTEHDGKKLENEEETKNNQIKKLNKPKVQIEKSNNDS